jgi:hypothetical protein
MKQARDQHKQKSSLSWLLLFSVITIGALVGISTFIKQNIETLSHKEITLSHVLPKGSDSNPPPFVF